ncbi:nucleoside hydrolase [Sphingobium sp. AP49]|uniref:nucleoside hydrolase n=1 Tax=Sphingobium sp. AP49 TaxID=1144307 RepID=UPI00026ED2F3|nr:nucleoside hydrolase [Sphingobium sp. AP49]WHO37177.1 nucleoside hydrolase [Sphingobium sp. AP49]
MPVELCRRHVLMSAAALMSSLAATAPGAVVRRHPLARVIVDNDFAGDPDGLFQLAHHLLCRSVDLPLIVCSHLPPAFGGPASATAAAEKVGKLLDVMKLDGRYSVVAGAERSFPSGAAWKPSPATAAIVREAMREDRREPLYYAAGAGLTELALAWRAEPRIGPRITLVWIGGGEHPGVAYPPPGPAEPEFNFSIDPTAAQIIFNESDIEIWQVPRDAYRQMLFSTAEMEDMAAGSALGRYLKDRLDEMAAMLATIPGFPPTPDADVYVLGDSPLVTLTALMTPLQPDPASSRYLRQPTPHLNEDGSYHDRPDGRAMRVYTAIDAALTFRDMVHKFARPLG